MSGAVTMMLLGAGIGGGVWLVAAGLRPRPIPLAVRIDAIDRPGRSVAESAVTVLETDRRSNIGRASVRILGAVGIGDNQILNERLRILDKSIERHAYEKLLAGVAGFALPLFAGIVLAVAGVGVHSAFIVSTSFVLGLAGFFYPDLPLAEQVERRQQSFRHALSSWLDLVTIILAGGGGIETALAGAAESGDGWAFAEIRRALRRAELTGRTPWEMLDQLGTTLHINELSELAASVSLAGGQGAKIRQSLAAKADSLRAQQAADIETNAEARTEKMIVRVTVMVIGLTLFIGFGAVDAISTDGGATYAPGSEQSP